MSQMTVPEMTERLSELMVQQAGVRGQSFADQFRKAPRIFRRHQRSAAKTLIEAQARSQHPRLARQTDMEAAEKAFKQLERHLMSLDPSDRRKGMLLGMAGGMVINILLLVAGGVIAWLVLQGTP